MTKGQFEGHTQEAQGKIKEVAGKLVGKWRDIREINMIAKRKVLSAAVIAMALIALPAMAWAAVDPYPNGCVSCHVLDKSKNVDSRLSVALKGWSAGKIEPGLLAKSKAAAPAGLALKGKHPAAADSLEDIPGACLDCHDAGSKKAPPFARLLHLVHLAGGVNNAYVTTYKSDCMHCHKLNTQTGEWSMPSAAEK